MSASATTGDVALPVVRFLCDDDPAARRAGARAACGPPPGPSRPGSPPPLCWSRSYSGRLAVVAGWPGRVGVDIEHLDAGPPLSHRRPPVAEVAEVIATPDERDALAGLAPPSRWTTLVDWWSAKEALAKALGDALRYEPQRLPTPARWADGRAGRWRAERLVPPAEADGPVVGWLVWEVPGDGPPWGPSWVGADRRSRATVSGPAGRGRCG